MFFQTTNMFICVCIIGPCAKLTFQYKNWKLYLKMYNVDIYPGGLVENCSPVSQVWKG